MGCATGGFLPGMPLIIMLGVLKRLFQLTYAIPGTAVVHLPSLARCIQTPKQHAVLEIFLPLSLTFSAPLRENTLVGIHVEACLLIERWCWGRRHHRIATTMVVEAYTPCSRLAGATVVLAMSPVSLSHQGVERDSCDINNSRLQRC